MTKKDELGKNVLTLEQTEWLTILHETLRMGNYGRGIIKNYNQTLRLSEQP